MYAESRKVMQIHVMVMPAVGNRDGRVGDFLTRGEHLRTLMMMDALDAYN
jgi:hypothetical protein